MTEHYFTNSIGKEERFTVTGAIACDRLDYYSADLVVKSRGGIFFTSSISWHYYAPNTRRDEVQDLCNLVICATFFSFFFIIVFLGSTDKRNKQIFSLGASWLLSGYMLDSLSHFEFNWQQRVGIASVSDLLLPVILWWMICNRLTIKVNRFSSRSIPRKPQESALSVAFSLIILWIRINWRSQYDSVQLQRDSLVE